MENKCIINPERDCIGLIKAEALEKRFDEHCKNSRDTHNELFDRIIVLEKADSARNQQYLNIMEKLNNMNEEITRTNTTLAEIMNRSAKKWDVMSEKVIWAIVAAIIAFVLGQIGIQ